jgi:hypothetical protein
MLSKDTLFLVALAIIVVAAAAVFTSYTLQQPSSYAVSVSLLSDSSANAVVYPFQTGNFTMTVSDTGKAPLNDMLLILYLNNQQLREYSINLQPGKSTTIETNYTYQQNGTYDFEAIADPAHILNITDRSRAQSSAIISVAQRQRADVYTSVPNNGINTTQSFSISGAGLYAAWFIAKDYNIRPYDSVFGFSKNIIGTTLNDLYTYIDEANGAYVSYDNGTAAYVGWFDGPISPAMLDSVLLSFHTKYSGLSAGGNQLTMFKVNASESICTYYSGGWTKLVEFYNGSVGGNCADIAAKSYASNQSTFFVGVLKNNTALAKAQSKFQYLNSTTAGYLLGMNESGVAATSIFANQFGLFMASVLRHFSLQPPYANLTCFGLITTVNKTEVCSTYVVPANGSLTTSFGLINSQAVGDNYTLGVYSLVNVSDIGAAYQNAADLIQALNISQAYRPWKSAFVNTCSTNSNSLPCSVANFSLSNDTGVLDIGNRFGSPIRLNNVECYIPGASNLPQGINKMIQSGQNASVGVQCYNLAIPVASAQTSYTLKLNYTLNGTTKLATGLLNITNFGG